MGFPSASRSFFSSGRVSARHRDGGAQLVDLGVIGVLHVDPDLVGPRLRRGIAEGVVVTGTRLTHTGKRGDGCRPLFQLVGVEKYPKHFFVAFIEFYRYFLNRIQILVFQVKDEIPALSCVFGLAL